MHHERFHDFPKSSQPPLLRHDNSQTAKSIFALAFNGSQLYAGAGDGFYAFGANSDITQYSGNANNCGTPKLLMGGMSVNGVAADGIGHVYFVGGKILYRFNVSAEPSRASTLACPKVAVFVEFQLG